MITEEDLLAGIQLGDMVRIRDRKQNVYTGVLEYDEEEQVHTVGNEYKLGRVESTGEVLIIRPADSLDDLTGFASKVVNLERIES